MRRLDEELKKKMNTHQENQLSLIEKQRRSWEITREKAEQMSQIFDSLIITSNKGSGHLISSESKFKELNVPIVKVTVKASSFSSIKRDQCPNLMNLSRVSNPPTTGFN